MEFRANLITQLPVLGHLGDLRSSSSLYYSLIAVQTLQWAFTTFDLTQDSGLVQADQHISAAENFTVRVDLFQVERSRTCTAIDAQASISQGSTEWHR